MSQSTDKGASAGLHGDSVVDPTGDRAEEHLDRAQQLMSSLLDDVITAEQAEELNRLLLENPSARKGCVDMAMLHADLLSFFNGKEPGDDTAAIAPSIQGLSMLDLLGIPSND